MPVALVALPEGFEGFVKTVEAAVVTLEISAIQLAKVVDTDPRSFSMALMVVAEVSEAIGTVNVGLV
jgi:hypothetical protein